jgi:hypothetical protein
MFKKIFSHTIEVRTVVYFVLMAALLIDIISDIIDK